MTKRLSNKKAREMSESELTHILCDYFKAVNGTGPSLEEKEGLREAAEWVKENTVEWTRVVRGIEDETWDPAEGARAIWGPG